MKHISFNHLQTNLCTVLVMASAALWAACGGAPAASGTTSDQQSSPPVATQNNPSQTDTAIAPESASPAAESPNEETVAAAPPADETAVAEEPKKAEPEFAAADKPIDDQISETKAEISAVQKKLTKSKKDQAAADTKLRLADKAKTKAAEKNAKDAAALADAVEKQKMVQEQLTEANRILGLANEALDVLKAKEPKTYKEKQDVEDSLKSQKEFVGQKSALVRKKTEALAAADKTVESLKKRADKSAAEATETQSQYDEAQKASATEKENATEAEARLAALNTHLTELKEQKKASEAAPAQK